MLTNQRVHSSFLPLLVGLLGVGVGIIAGFFAGAKPLYLCLALVAVPVLIFFFTKFEQTVMGSIDPTFLSRFLVCSANTSCICDWFRWPDFAIRNRDAVAWSSSTH
ncbi:MAG: hypothetical protein KatS3mg066_2008 [Fischerella sp.]|nr:MAG: hypothetical protein KatS3mg066_2008 [Fischerella sp.]